MASLPPDGVDTARLGGTLRVEPVAPLASAASNDKIIDVWLHFGCQGKQSALALVFKKLFQCSKSQLLR